MLFTTATFVVAFLPIALIVFFLIGRRSEVLASVWLFAASVFFYGYWMPEFTLLLLGSIAINFSIGRRIGLALEQPERLLFGLAVPKSWLIAGVLFNLGLLAYFKYANFFVDNLSAALDFEWDIGRIILPIGISFYSFTQIAFLVDTWQGKVREFRPIHYGLFVTYFPHLIAGPVLHHAQMMPQFGNKAVYRFNAAHFFAGMAIFAIGLFKKVVLADGVAPYADAIFIPVDGGQLPGVGEAWLGALAYTFQLYFDFSGYSDMAVGLSWMFNIRLPYNFDSPYKATSISDFWRRWHISLSTFLRDYLYIQLGGNKKGAISRYFNLSVTMVLGGLWHGASWSFVLWGALHGAYLMVNHGFRAVSGRFGWSVMLDRSRAFTVFAWVLTFTATAIAWVFFRAQTNEGAVRMLVAMAGFSGATDGADVLLWNAGLDGVVGAGWCLALGLAAVSLPNSNALGERLMQWFRQSRDACIAGGGAAAAVVLLLVILNGARNSVSAFIYFNF